MGKKMASGQKIEPSPIAGKAAFIPVKVQAAHDGENLYIRFSWKQPAASGAAKMDDKNPVKIAFMLESGGKVELADQSGCWATCHTDSRTMPGADEAKTKYVKGGSLAEGKFYDLYQWRSGENKAYNGYIAEERVMEGEPRRRRRTVEYENDVRDDEHDAKRRAANAALFHRESQRIWRRDCHRLLRMLQPRIVVKRR